jgi:formate C-acetyltransferase
MHEKLSQDFAMKAAELCSLGMGYPAWFGDKSSILYLLDKGYTLEEARDYAMAGCVVHVVPHKTAATWPINMSMPKVLELALNDGIDPRTGKQLGLKTGKFEDFNYDDLYKAFKEQVKYILKDAAIYNAKRLYRAAMMPQLAASLFFDDCIKRGQDPLGGGCRYQDCMYILPIGLIDVADSLAAVKQRVFEEGAVSKQELIDALKANFDGKESIRKLLLSSHKYGNDDDYADNIAADLYSWLCELMGTIDAPYGSKWVVAPHSVALHGAAGRKVGALPSGRLAGVSLADGAVSPCQGADVNGPTGVINSAGKIDQVRLLGVLLNVKFHPSALKTKDDLRNLLAFIKTYLIDYGGKHIQFNVISRETLLDAQEHPERYRNLVVRVAGYSALWVELDRTIQNEIISRTEHSL